MNRANEGPTPARRPAKIAASVLLAAGLVACGSSTTGDEDRSDAPGLSADGIAAATASAQQAEEAPTAIAQTVPLSKKPPTGKLIAFLQDPAPPSVEQFAGLTDAAAAVGWRAESVKFNPADLATFNAGLLQALSMGADYVVNSGVPESQISKSTVERFKSAGVPIVVLDTTPVPQTETLLGDSGGESSRVRAGAQLADWFVADSQGTGSAVVVNITTYPTLTLFAESLEDQVEKTCPSCKTTPLKQTFDDALNGNLTANVVAKLRSDRTIKYAVFDNSAEIAGLDPALKAAGLDDIKLIGHSIDPTTVQSMQSGQAKTFMAYNFRYGGWRAMDIALRHSVGDPTEDPDAVTPYQLMTKDNVGQLPPEALFRAPDDSLEQFKKLWLVSGTS